VDIEALAAIKKKAAALEAQLNKAGIAPEAQVSDAPQAQNSCQRP